MDKYDKAIEYLTAHPEKIHAAWDSPSRHPDGVLFQFASRDPLNHNVGCLTQVKSGRKAAETPELTAAIRADKRIPSYAGDITPDDLPTFAEWQRRLDLELGRED